MKPSHFTTPRTMDEATFYPGGAAIEIPSIYSRASAWSIAVSIAAVVIGIFAAYLLVTAK